MASDGWRGEETNRGQHSNKGKNQSFVVVLDEQPTIRVHDFVGWSPNSDCCWPKVKAGRERPPSDGNISIYSKQTNKLKSFGLTDWRTVRRRRRRNCIINSIKQKLNQNVRRGKISANWKIISSHVGPFYSIVSICSLPSAPSHPMPIPMPRPNPIYFDRVGLWSPLTSRGDEQLKTTRPAGSHPTSLYKQQIKSEESPRLGNSDRPTELSWRKA